MPATHDPTEPSTRWLGSFTGRTIRTPLLPNNLPILLRSTNRPKPQPNPNEQLFPLYTPPPPHTLSLQANIDPEDYLRRPQAEAEWIIRWIKKGECRQEIFHECFPNWKDYIKRVRTAPLGEMSRIKNSFEAYSAAEVGKTQQIFEFFVHCCDDAIRHRSFPTNPPTDPPTSPPTDPPTDAPKNIATNRPTNPPIDPPTDSRTTDHLTNRPANRPTKQPATPPTPQPTSSPASKPTDRPTNQPTNKHTNK